MIINKNKIIIILYLFSNIIILSSCTVDRELKNLALVTAIGIDKEENQMVITCEISNPLNGPDSEGSLSKSDGVIFIQGRGKTLFEAIRETTLNFDKKLVFSHAQILIIGEELAKEGITQHLDYILRSQEPREDIKIVVSKGCKAYDIIGIKGDLSGSGGEYIKDMLEKSKLNDKTINVSLAEYFRYYYDENGEPVIGVVQREERKLIPGEKNDSGDSKIILNIGGGAVTKQDHLIGYFTPEEMFGFNFIVDKIKRGVITIYTPNKLDNNMSIIGNEGKYTSIEVTKSKTKNDIKLKDGNVYLDINVKLKCSLIEENRPINLDNEEILKFLENACSAEVEKIIKKTFDKGQKKFKQDNFSIGETIHKKHPKIWKEISKDWDHIFPEVIYDVNVETRIVKIGNTNIPANLRKGR